MEWVNTFVIKPIHTFRMIGFIYPETPPPEVFVIKALSKTEVCNTNRSRRSGFIEVIRAQENNVIFIMWVPTGIAGRGKDS